MMLSKKLTYACLNLILLNFGSLLFSQNPESEGSTYKDSALPLHMRVEDLLSRMSLEEKVAQMRIFHANKGIEMGEDDEMILSEDVVNRLKYGIAGIKNPGEHISPLRAAKLNNQLQKYIIENNRWGIPALFVTESYNGVDAAGCTSFGRPITMASSFNTDLVNRVWDVVGREARLRGMHMCHSPEADIVRDPRFGRMSEAFGEDTYLTTQMVVNAIKGVQGDYEGLGEGTHIGAVAKHFAGYGQILGGTNFSAIEISPRTLIDEIYPPFKGAVQEARSLGIMASHGDLNGIASHGNPELLTGVLRDQWGFEGYVVSDANDVGRLHYFMKVAETPEDAAIMGLTAGVDIDLYADDAYALLPAIVQEKPEIMTYIDQAASRVLRTKFILGLFDKPYVDIDEVEKEVRKQESLELAKEADLESIILLKNEQDILPLKKGQHKKIALLGPLLEENTAEQLSALAGEGVSFIAEQGFTLTNEKGGAPKLNPPNDAAIKKMVKLAKKADLILLYLGGDEFTAKEAYFANALGDRADITLVGQQDELLEKVKALGKPIIVILKHRRTLAINKIAEEADAILDCWDLSEFGDESIGKILFGEVSPSGKLPVTVPRTIGQLPFHYSQKEINYKKEYLFTKKGPLYPFGFGLSYTKFTYSELELSQPRGSADTLLVASVSITNSGERAAKEVVQLYVKDKIASIVRPDKELKGFKKIQLAAGETQRVSFAISQEMLEFTGWEMEKVMEAGDFLISIGSSSSEGVSANFKLTEKLISSIQKSSIEKSMVKALKWQEAHPIFAKAPTDWTNGAYYTGVVRAHKTTQNEAFLSALKEMGVRNKWQTWERFYHADDLAISYAYLYLNKIDPSIVNLQPTANFIDDHLHKSHPWREGIEGRNQQILWWWCDALFMAPPVLASFAKHKKEDAFLDQMHDYYLETYNLLFDKEEHLFARDLRFKWDGDEKDLKEENGKKIFWSRGNGWVLGGLALILDEMPQDYEHRAFYEQLFLKMAAKIKSIQPEDGLWMTSLLSPESYNHGEVSGSGFYTFALAWGINNGLLDKEEYGPVVKKAWEALQACQHENGKVGWVQNIGAEPKPATKHSWQNYGTGAFLLAGSEILKMK